MNMGSCERSIIYDIFFFIFPHKKVFFTKMRIRTLGYGSFSFTAVYLANSHESYVQLHQDFYRVSAVPLSMANAQADCAAEGGTIATFKTEEQFMILKNANGNQGKLNQV